MSVQRVFTPLASPASLVSRFAFSASPSSLRPCSHILRTFSSSHARQSSSRRKMQTSTAYTPYPLTSPPPPPRNSGIPDTSIAGGIPQVNDTRPPTQAQQYEVAVETPAEEKTSISVPEGEAQVSRPTTAPAETPRAKPRPKLRARKAAMKLTDGAVRQLREMLNQPEPKLIKVGVRNRGCSGLAYHLEYVEKPGMFDEEVEQDGVKVLIDSKALFSIIGSEMDWVEDKLNQRFVFSNPNISKFTHCLRPLLRGGGLIERQRNNADAVNRSWYEACASSVHTDVISVDYFTSVALAWNGVLSSQGRQDRIPASAQGKWHVDRCINQNEDCTTTPPRTSSFLQARLHPFQAKPRH